MVQRRKTAVPGTHHLSRLVTMLYMCVSRPDIQILAIGKQGSGKSTCLRYLTQGVERWVLHRSKVKNAVVTEVGGAVIGLWSRYLNPKISVVLFFIDIDDKSMISESAVELYTFLTHASLGPEGKRMQMTKIVLVQTKADRSTCLNSQELEFLLGLGGIMKQWGGQMEIVRASSTRKGGYDELIEVLRSIEDANNTL